MSTGLGLGIGIGRSTQRARGNTGDDPMPIGNNAIIALDGDSHLAQGNVIGSGADLGNNEIRWSWGNQALFYSGHAGTVPWGYNVAVSGQALGPSDAAYDTVLKRQAATNALGAQVVLLSALGNDISGGASAAVCLSRLDQYIAGSTATYIVCPTIPRRFGGQAFTTGQEAIRQAVNAGIMAKRSAKFRPVDVEDTITSTVQTFDEIHFNAAGSGAIGARVAEELRRLILPNDATTFPINSDNFISAFTGTGGNKNTATGSVPNGYTLEGTYAGGASVSMAIDTDGFPVMTVDGTYTGNDMTAQLYRFGAYTAPVAGDEVEFFAEIQILEKTLGVLAISIGGYVQDGWPPMVSTGFSNANSVNEFGLGVGRYVLRNRGRCRAGTAQSAAVFFNMQFRGAAVASPVRGKIKILSMGARLIRP